ncbi:uncharacterized protein LOC121870096, partial [Homarus americanus]|uniref:uncharacterized protein LOC121870096 n=1 Tax=Homarus americanus TaxID=6706 RepID=UPI001C46BC78
MPQQEPLRTLPPQTTPLTFSCNPSRIGQVDVIRYGRAYHFSWCHDSGRTYTWEEADGYCRGLGHNFQAISIVDQSEDIFMNQVLSENPIPWIWTSGHKTYDWFWGTGALLQYNNWSHTGG